VSPWFGSQQPSAELQETWRRDGFVLMPGIVPTDMLDEVQTDVAAFRARCGETKDAAGFGDWIGMLHLELESCLRLAAQPPVLSFLKWALDDTPLLFGSLNFERGSERVPHIDTIFFHTIPVTAMAGVWFALEDVSSDSGPLNYVPGSHRWPLVTGERVVAESTDLRDEIEAARNGTISDAGRGELVSELGHRHEALMAAEVQRRNEEAVPVLAKRGDCIVWHALVAHGGLPRANPLSSRRSMVFHFIGRHARLYPFEDFFLKTPDELESLAGMQTPVQERGDLAKGFAHMAHGYVAFVVDGEQVSQPLSERR